MSIIKKIILLFLLFGITCSGFAMETSDNSLLIKKETVNSININIPEEYLTEKKNLLFKISYYILSEEIYSDHNSKLFYTSYIRKNSNGYIEEKRISSRKKNQVKIISENNKLNLRYTIDSYYRNNVKVVVKIIDSNKILKVFKKNILLGKHSIANPQRIASVQLQGSETQFETSIYDSDGFEDVSNVFFVFSTSDKQPNGPAVGYDLEKQKYLSGTINKNVFHNQKNLLYIDKNESSTEWFFTIIRFYPYVKFSNKLKGKRYLWVGAYDKFLGWKWLQKGMFEIIDENSPLIKDFHVLATTYETKIVLKVKDVDHDLSYINFKVKMKEKTINLKYDLTNNIIYERKNGKLHTLKNSSLKVFNLNIINLISSKKVEFSINKNDITVYAMAVDKKGNKSKNLRLGTVKTPKKLSDQPLLTYNPKIKESTLYLDWQTTALKEKRKLVKNSSIMLMRAKAPYLKPNFMSDKEFNTRFPYDSLSVVYPLTEYPLTHIIWSYSPAINFQKKYVKNVNYSFSTSTLNFDSLPIDSKEINKLSAKDFDGNSIIPIWKLNFTRHRENLAATNSNYFVRLHKGLDFILKQGADSIQLDDFPNGGHLVTMGGGFSKSSIKGFAQWLNKKLSSSDIKKYKLPSNLKNFNYKKFLQKKYGFKNSKEYLKKLESIPTTKLFRQYHWFIAKTVWKDVKRYVNLKSPNKKIFITSNGSPDWVSPTAYAYNSKIVDMMVAEVHTYPKQGISNNPILAYMKADALETRMSACPKGKENYYLKRNKHPELINSYIAEAYALGQQFMVPWSWYSEGESERFYANPKDFNNIFNFISKHNDLFDGFERIANTGVIIRYNTHQPKIMRIINKLLQEHIPFTLFFADNTLEPRNLKEEQLKSVDYLITVDPITWYKGEINKKLLHKYEYKMLVQPNRDIIKLSDKNIYVIPKINKNTTIFHLLNRNYDTENKKFEIKKNFVIKIKRNFFSTEIKSINYYLPVSNKEYTLRFKNKGDYIEIEIPSLDIYGIIEIKS